VIAAFTSRESTQSRGYQLAACCAMHAVNDGLFAAVYPLLPLIAAGLGLSYAEAGAVKTVFSASSGILQVPAGVVAERAGEHLLLALGTGWVGFGLLGMAFAGSFVPLLALALLAGIGGNTQHPVATGIVSRLYEGPRRGTAIGTLNFAGDVGKVLAPIAVGAATLAYGWRGGLLALGALGLLGALLYLLIVPLTPPLPRTASSEEQPVASSEAPPPPLATRYSTLATDSGADAGGWGIDRPAAFTALTVVGVLDSAARGASLTFIPFLLAGKGLDPARMSFYFTILFAAGAAGKFICGPLADRFGNVAIIVITELITAGALLALLSAPLAWSIVCLLPLGFVLNGTSSVLYAAVAGLVHSTKRARGYGLYYTAIQLASAGAPIVYGLLADRAGLTTTFVAMAGATAAIVSLTLATARSLQDRP